MPCLCYKTLLNDDISLPVRSISFLSFRGTTVAVARKWVIPGVLSITYLHFYPGILNILKYSLLYSYCKIFLHL